MIYQILGNIHVCTPFREAAAHVISKLKDGRAQYRRMPRADRRRMLQQIAYAHRQNYELYRDVMSGNIKRRVSK